MSASPATVAALADELLARGLDEAAELRAALRRGEWRRLTDPLLPLLLLADPSDWGAERYACAEGALRFLDGPMTWGGVEALRRRLDRAPSRLYPTVREALAILDTLPAETPF